MFQEKTLFFLGVSPLDSIQNQRVDSANMNTRTGTALNIIDYGKEEFYDNIDLDAVAQLEIYLQKIF